MATCLDQVAHFVGTGGPLASEQRVHFVGIRSLLSTNYEVLYSTYLFQALTLPLLMVRALPFRLGFTKNAGLISAEAEHATNQGVAASIISRVLDGEFARVERGLGHGWGSSLLFVARKKS